MKPNQELSQLTLEELQARKNKLKGAIIGLGIVMVVALSVVLYLVARSKNYGLLAVCFASFITLMPSVIALNQVNEEIKSRSAA